MNVANSSIKEDRILKQHYRGTTTPFVAAKLQSTNQYAFK